ncbi:MAG TPA: serine/threonine-protein kinase [Pirellulales bacterium]|nr:serine/threonine-protein kinase [Pirellulales bacterium]
MQEQSIFIEALEKKDRERAAFLDRVCGDAPDLRQRIERLLERHQENDSFLERHEMSSSPTVDHPIVERPGTVIGSYKLLEQIGEGGFGVVFMAEQQQPVRRKVALKVLKPGMDTRQVVARFEAERQALALMDHPHIAHVFDGGATDVGRPYFVMELVRGVPITEFCDQSCLTIRQRLELFVDVCEAVQHAHQKGIIHRDIKPTNVLVTLHDGTPVVKVIDFGIAKAMGQQLTEKTLFTNFAQLIGTPLYMSPEQAEMSGLDVDTRSDIYSLGVLLYELLTGTTPFENERLSKVGYDEMRRIIREEEPPKPSTRISTVGKVATTTSKRCQADPRRLSKLLRGELDWIVMKALEKDRNRRYETANGFALDVTRYLRDEPVEACPPSAAYRLGKFARKHRHVLSLAAASALLLATATAVSGWMAFRARLAEQAMGRERDRAEAEAKGAQENFEIAKNAVEDYLSKVTQDPDLTRADFNALRKKLLDSAVPFYQRLVERKPGDAAQEVARGYAYGRLAHLRAQMGEMEEALADAEQARAIFAKLAADFPAVPEYHRGLAERRRSLGYCLYHLGRHDEAESAYRAALAIQEKLAADSPTVPEHRSDLAITHLDLGLLLSDLGKRDEAESAYRDALAIQEKLAADFPAIPQYRENLSKTRINLGALLMGAGKRDEAESAYRDALAIQEKLAADFPTIPEFRDRLAATRGNLGILLTDLGKYDEAESALRAALAIQEELAADFPTVPKYRENLARTRNNLGTLLTDLNKPDQAESVLRAALATYEKLAADFPKVPEYRRLLALVHNNLGKILAVPGKYEEAEATLRAALATYEKLAADFPTVPKYRSCLALARNNLGRVLTNLGKHDEAEAALRAALASYEKLAADFPTVPQYRSELALTRDNLGRMLADQGKHDEAEAAYRAALAIREKLVADAPTVPQYREELAVTHGELGHLYARAGQWREAASQYDRCLDLDAANHGCWMYAAALHAATGDLDGYRRTCAQMVEQFGDAADAQTAERTAKACLLMPDALSAADFDRVQELADRAITGTEKNGYYGFFAMAKGLADYRAGRYAEAITWMVRSGPNANGGNWDATKFAVLAMSRHRLGQIDEAQSALASAKACLAKMPDLAKGQLFGAGTWHDWLHAQILYREAEVLLKKSVTETERLE